MALCIKNYPYNKYILKKYVRLLSEYIYIVCPKCKDLHVRGSWLTANFFFPFFCVCVFFFSNCFLCSFSLQKPDFSFMNLMLLNQGLLSLGWTFDLRWFGWLHMSSKYNLFQQNHDALAEGAGRWRNRIFDWVFPHACFASFHTLVLPHSIRFVIIWIQSS